jgi:hypothetical protein
MQFSENVCSPRGGKGTSSSDKWDKHLSSFRKDDFWTAVRACVASLTIPTGLELQYADASLTIHDKNKKVAVKVTTTGEVHVERKLAKLEFKSYRFTHQTVTEAIEQFTVCLVQNFPISRPS